MFVLYFAPVQRFFIQIQFFWGNSEARPVADTIGNMTTTKVQLKDWANVNLATKFLERRGSDETPFLLYLGINLPHPYKTVSAGPDAGGSTFRSSPFYLEKVNEENIPNPTWKNFDDEHPVGLE